MCCLGFHICSYLINIIAIVVIGTELSFDSKARSVFQIYYYYNCMACNSITKMVVTVNSNKMAVTVIKIVAIKIVIVKENRIQISIHQNYYNFNYVLN